MDLDPDPGGPQTYGSDGSGSATLLARNSEHPIPNRKRRYYRIRNTALVQKTGEDLDTATLHSLLFSATNHLNIGGGGGGGGGVVEYMNFGFLL
jgi:hypothetical protein